MNRMRGTPTILALAALVLAVAAGGCRSVRDWRARRAASRPPFRVVTPTIAYEIMRDNPGILILDLRRPNEFNDDNGHLRGATNIPLAGLRGSLPKIAAFREETFLLYCRKNDRCAEEGITLLLKRGFTDPILIDGGIEGWIDKGMKTYLPADAVGRVSHGLAPELALPRKETELPVATKEEAAEKPPAEEAKPPGR